MMAKDTSHATGLSMITGRPMPSSGVDRGNLPLKRAKAVEMKAVHATRLKLEEFLSAIVATVRTALRPKGQEAAMNQQVSETEVG
jgi:hypothetical protein